MPESVDQQVTSEPQDLVDHDIAWTEHAPEESRAHQESAPNPEIGNWVIGNWKLIESSAITNYIW